LGKLQLRHSASLGLRGGQTAADGHFGRTDIDLPWELTDKIDELKSAV
jgi:S-adenosylmethionine synthetase